MKVSSVSRNLYFQGKIAKTDNGNNYEKSNTGKIALTSMALLDSFGNILIDHGQTKFGVVGDLLIATGVGLGLGWLIDHSINKKRRKDADLFAKTGKKLPIINNGKKTGTIIGAGMGGTFALISLTLNKASKESLIKTGVELPIISLIGLCFGAIYDRGVNKFREKLATKENFAE